MTLGAFHSRGKDYSALSSRKVRVKKFETEVHETLFQLPSLTEEEIGTIKSESQEGE
jgi:hypothetical protein